jgi:serine/threonine protein phosphatase PrpC
MPLEYEAISDQGLKRQTNQDSHLAARDTGLFAVADGMGGQAGGETASSLAITILRDFIKRSLDVDDTWPTAFDPALSRNQNRLRSALALANKKIKSLADSDPKLQGMGTTAVCALIEGDTATIAHIGDSRAYLFRGGKLELLTADHSWVGEQVAQGVISEDQARQHPLRNVVTRALGTSSELSADFADIPLQAGDLLLLCSDGLNSMVPDEVIGKIIETRTGDLKACAKALIAEANKGGGQDNITIILVRYS